MPLRDYTPWLVGAGVVAAGTLAGAAIVRAATKADCSSVGADGGTAAGVPYLERMRGGASPDERVPMVVMLHSMDGSPKGYAGGLGGIGRARLILPQGGIDSGGGYRWLPTTLGGTLKDGFSNEEFETWLDALERLETFVDAIADCRPTVGKPIITGSSQGAIMTLLMATARRGKIHGAVAVNGDLPDAFWNGKMTPTIMINGTGDTNFPFAQAQEHAQIAIDEGAPLRLDSYSSSTHEVTPAMGKAWGQAVGDFVAQIG